MKNKAYSMVEIIEINFIYVDKQFSFYYVNPR